MVFVAGCATTEKKAKKYYLENKDELAELCSDCFPVKSEFKPGKPIQLPSDTVYRPGIPIIMMADCPDGTQKPVECPPNDTIEIYTPIQIRDTIVQADSAAIYYWQAQHTKVTAEKKEVELEKAGEIADKKFYRKWFWILAAVIGLNILWRLWKFYQSATTVKIS